jgi:hypothetical protein
VSAYGVDDRAVWVRSLAEGKDFSSGFCVQIGSGAHPASCPMGSVGLLPGGKARPSRDADHSPQLVSRSKMSRSQASPWLVMRQLYFNFYLFFLLFPQLHSIFCPLQDSQITFHCMHRYKMPEILQRSSRVEAGHELCFLLFCGYTFLVSEDRDKLLYHTSVLYIFCLMSTFYLSLPPTTLDLIVTRSVKLDK